MLELSLVERYEDVGSEAAQEVATVLADRKHPVLALPTGGTPRGMYTSIVKRVLRGEIRFSHAHVFNLDEYLDLAPTDSHTFRSYMNATLWSGIAHHPASWVIPDSSPSDPMAECRAYDRALVEAGTLDLAVVGIGENGHLAFNEPGTPWTSTTHVSCLSLETRRAAALAFGGLIQTPTRAITMGLASLLAARRILLLVAGRGKSAILARALLEPPHAAIPASILQTHPNVRILADMEAASEL